MRPMQAGHSSTVAVSLSPWHWSMQAQDPRFVNASVEFNVDTLRPTYRLLWGTAGASHALSVAEGLKFDPVVIADARRIATSDGLAMQAGGRGQQHAEAMKVGMPSIYAAI